LIEKYLRVLILAGWPKSEILLNLAWI